MITRTEHEQATRIATEAGQALLSLRQNLESDGSNAREIGAAADRHSHDLVVRALSAVYRQDLILSEERVETWSGWGIGASGSLIPSTGRANLASRVGRTGRSMWR